MFGSHALVYTVTSNYTNRRSILSIVLRKSNGRGGHSFVSLYTGKRLHSYESTELPIDKNFIEQVKNLSSFENVPLVKDKYPMFEWAPGIPLSDETQEETSDIIDED